MKLMVIFLAMMLFSAADNLPRQKASFSFVQNEQGVELRENGQPVFFYQKAAVSVMTGGHADRKRMFNHYIHPLYNLAGEIISEAHPEHDKWHPHHRGIFWAWHQIKIDGRQIADSWTMKDFTYDIQSVKTTVSDKSASLILDVDWKSKNVGPDAFVSEHTVITVFASRDNRRLIDFKINLKANLPNVSIAGSKDTVKGYGGFSARIKLADSMIFKSQEGILEPIVGQMNAGPWVDFSTYGLSFPEQYGLAVFCHPTIPNFPSPWLLRRQASMQNPAFPGWEDYTLAVGKTLALHYGLVIHDGDAAISEIDKWYHDFIQK